MNETGTKARDHAEVNRDVESVFGKVVDEYLRQMQAGEKPDVEQFAVDHPEIASLIREAFPVLKVVNDSMTEVNSGEGLNLSRSKQLGDFRLLHELGSGGMGFVYEAEQLSMGRRVALKILPMAGALQQKQLQRFRNEVRAVAMLDHPNIVSVYSVGEDRGVHYYAMQLIRGQSLAEVISELSQRRASSGSLDADSINQVLSSADRPQPSAGSYDPTQVESEESNDVADNETRTSVRAKLSTVPGSSTDGGFFESLARLGIQAAQGLQHAHDQGVLHRDIKPGNLMLDADAQLHITDFGLAQIDTGVGMTMTGDLVGTLRYMSPEQALAKRVVIDHRSDIYSLGATLYELLTLQHAFTSSDRQELLKQIAFEEPRKPRQIDHAIPRELETIVLKAMEKSPDLRYSLASDLADDLRAFLEHRPIKAKPPSIVQRGQKWAWRHQSFMWTAGVSAVSLLIMVVLGLTISNRVITRERNAAEQASVLAEERFRLALRAVDEYLNQVTEDEDLQNMPLENLRRRLLESAVPFLEELVVQVPADETALAAKAESLERLAKIRRTLGEHDAARRSYEESLTVADQLVNQHGDRIEHQRIRADCYHGLGKTFLVLGRIGDGLSRFRQAVRVRSAIAAESQDASDRKDLARSHYNVSLALRLLNKYDESKAESDRSLAIWRGLTTEFPDQVEYALGMAQCGNGIGLVYMYQGRLDEACSQHEASIKSWTDLIHRYPENRRIRWEKGCSHGNYALALAETKELDKAQQQQQKAIDVYRKLTEEFPGVPSYHKDLANAINNLSSVLRARGQFSEARDLLIRNVDELERLTAEFPDVPEHRLILAMTHGNLGQLCRQIGQLDEAPRHHDRCIEQFESLVKQFPNSPKYRFNLAQGYYVLGGLLSDLGEYADACLEHGEPIEIQLSLSNDFKDRPDYAEFLSQLHNDMGATLNKRGEHQEARRHQQKSFDILGRLVTEFPNTASSKYLFAIANHNRGQHAKAVALCEELISDFPENQANYLTLLAASTRGIGESFISRDLPEDATRHLKHAVQTYREYLTARPGHGSAKVGLVDCLQKLMIAQSRSGMHQSAAQTQGECLDAFESAIESLSSDHPAIVSMARESVDDCIALKNDETTRENGLLALRSWETALRPYAEHARDYTGLLKKIAAALESMEAEEEAARSR